jgi:hypothetical protein
MAGAENRQARSVWRQLSLREVRTMIPAINGITGCIGTSASRVEGVSVKFAG